MSALSINPPYPVFPDIDGQPLEDGYIWIGTAGMNPISNPIVVYWDAALTIPAPQPIRTIGGFPARAGSPARLYVNSDYSIQVQNKNGTVTYSAPVATEAYGGGIINASQVIYDPAGVGAVQTTVQAKLRETVSVKDFGAVGDGVADDTTAFNAALSAADTVFVPEGIYKLTSTISIPQRKSLIGVGYKSRLAASSISGAVISITSGNGPTTVSGFRISGSATTGMSVNNGQVLIINNISLDGLTATNGFVFVSSWGSSYTNLWTNGATISNACFICGQDFNANQCTNWYTSNRATYSLLIDGLYNGGSGVSHGSTWSMMCVQSTVYGIYVGSYQGGAFNGVYSEDIVFPLTLGSNPSKLARGMRFSGGDFGGPSNTNPSYSLREAVINFDYAIGCSIDGIDLSGAFNCGAAAPITFSGGGGSGAFAIARVTAAGAVHSVEVICGGTGYTSDPSALVGGSGIGAVLTVTRSGTSVSTIAVSSGGSGYVAGFCPVAITYNKAIKCTVGSAMFNSSFGDFSPLYPWIVRKSGANSGSGITLTSDTSWRNAANGNAATLYKTRSFGFTHALLEWDNTGTQQAYIYTPPQYP